jgi:hypothetical protein
MASMKYLAAAALALALFTPALGQVRNIPQEAKRARISHLEGMLVDIDGKRARLSPGAQIRDPDNRLVLPAHLPAKSDVKYVLDNKGLVHRVWILSAREKAQAK